MNKRYVRYHDSIFYPDDSDKMIAEFLESVNSSGALTFTLHSIKKLFKSCAVYGNVLFEHFTDIVQNKRFSNSRVFEIYVKDREISKACFRVELEDLPVDIILVISRIGVVITVYTTNKKDEHTSMNKQLYATE